MNRRPRQHARLASVASLAPLLALALSCDPGDRCVLKAGAPPLPDGQECRDLLSDGTFDGPDSGASSPDASPDAIDSADSGDDADPGVYPPGPYGKQRDDIAANHELDTHDGSRWSFAQARRDPDARIFFVSTAAGWCTACREEQSTLVALHEEYASAGLRIVVAVFEDPRSRPATAAYATQWKSNYGLPFTVVVDDRNQFGAYYDTSLAPMNLFIDSASMKIIEVSVGFDETQVRALLSNNL